MKVEVYPDGAYDKRRTYDLPPPLAAVRYPHDVGIHRAYDLVVVPVDDEARALTGWQVDPSPEEGESAKFMLFRASPQPLQFDTTMINTFNQYTSKK